MPTIYDNIEKKLLTGLNDALRAARRADFCVGYFNLRGWRGIIDAVDNLPGENGECCRLIIGMSQDPRGAVGRLYGVAPPDATQKTVRERNLHKIAKQLEVGFATAADEAALRRLREQLQSGKVKARFFARHPLHAKLYLAHRDDAINPTIAFLGSSNLTLAGLEKQGELNIDVVDGDTAAKLSRWFDARWEDEWCDDVNLELADIIAQSWAGDRVTPHQIYIKTAYHISREAIGNANAFPIPEKFQGCLHNFQEMAVKLAVERINCQNGVIVGDVVGLGKTIVASAVAKIYQEDHGGNALFICPLRLQTMWNRYLRDYRIAGETLPLTSVAELKNMPGFDLVVIDESHNFRNRDSQRYAQVRDYIQKHDCRVLLLTATPYNKSFNDLASQLRLFVGRDSDLGIRPEHCLREMGEASFLANHPNTLVSSIAAFEKSEHIEDWRELMRMFMIRRTRGYIIRHYAKRDEEKPYIEFADGERFYFPRRKPERVDFDGGDQYAKLYSPDVVEIIGELHLPRYGLEKHLLPEIKPSDEEKKIIDNLTRAGTRLRGFARSGLFKRLESGGDAFLISIRRHIVRNAAFLCAVENGSLPIGKPTVQMDDFFDDHESNDDDLGLSESDKTAGRLDALREAGSAYYEQRLRGADRCEWLPAKYFAKSLAEDLEADSESLASIFDLVPRWNPAQDGKLAALVDLCRQKPDDKILIFTQFKDTANYLGRELKERHGVKRVESVCGGHDDIERIICRFSPTSNGGTRDGGELRVLVSTDVLSEGQNLQDAHIVVNYDLPWALIRLVQRAGRVDRIGQKAEDVLCYSFMPNEGVEEIINLRNRLCARIKANNELIGSDEIFFTEDEKAQLRDLYAGTISLEDKKGEGEVDLISLAYSIWSEADPELKAKIEKMPNLVYSARKAESARNDRESVVAYVKTGRGQHTLAQVSPDKKILSQSQWEILHILECAPETPRVEPAESHHDLVKIAVETAEANAKTLADNLGGPRSPRRRAYDRIQLIVQQRKGTLFEHSSDTEELREVRQAIYDRQLQKKARDRLRRQLTASVDDDGLEKMILRMWRENALCVEPRDDAEAHNEPSIICSLGIVK